MAWTFAGFDRITSDPDILGGKPCVRGMRLSVQRVLQVLAENPSWEELRADYPDLEPDDIRQVLAFAASQVDDEVLPLEAS
ncbi:MAG TPA: DUF433 domain-containing protein [Planctomycetota bacterium]|nr:DUF433 domain-containing protein [Planctomycetota bacterium]